MAQVRLNEVWAATGGMTDPGDAKYTTGWQAEIPTFQDFNYLLNGLDTNIKQLATQPNFDWESDIEYLPGAQAMVAGSTFYALVANTNINPSTDTTGVTWSRAPVIGSIAHKDHKNMGLNIFAPGVNNSTNWTSSTMTLDDETPNIFFKRSTSGSTRNGFLLANINSSMCIVDTAQTGLPDGMSISHTSSDVHVILHEENHEAWHIANPMTFGIQDNHHKWHIDNPITYGRGDNHDKWHIANPIKYSKGDNHDKWHIANPMTFGSSDNHSQWHIDNPINVPPQLVEIPKGTTMLFIQATLPVGWTRVKTYDNRMMRITSTNHAGVGGHDDPVLWTHDHSGHTSYQVDTHDDQDYLNHVGDKSRNGLHRHVIPDQVFKPKYVNTMTCKKN